MSLLEKLQQKNLNDLIEAGCEITILSDTGKLLMKKNFISNIHLGITKYECISLVNNAGGEYVAIITDKEKYNEN